LSIKAEAPSKAALLVLSFMIALNVFCALVNSGVNNMIIKYFFILNLFGRIIKNVVHSRVNRNANQIAKKPGIK
jgi:hypothetical protein